MIDFKWFWDLVRILFVCASAALLLRRFVRTPTSISKLLHIILLCSLFVWIYAFHTWWIASLAALVLLQLYIRCCSAEKLDCYSELLTEQKAARLNTALFLCSVCSRC